MISKPESQLCLVTYTECMLQLCATVLIAVYAEYCLWYALPDVIALAREVGVGMSVSVGLSANVRKCLRLFEVIKSTRYEQ